MKTHDAMPKIEKQAVAPFDFGPLLIACALIFGITFYPRPLTTADGHADHGVLMLLLWSMMSGLIRGVGFIPQNRVARWFFSAMACYLGLGLGILVFLFKKHIF